MPTSRLRRILVCGIVLGAALAAAPGEATSTPAPELLEKLRAGLSLRLIVEFDGEALREELLALAHADGRHYLGPEELGLWRTGMNLIKQSALGGIQDIDVQAHWEFLSLSLLHVHTEAALIALVQRDEVVRVFDDGAFTIPEPATAALLAGGLAWLALRARGALNRPGSPAGSIS